MGTHAVQFQIDAEAVEERVRRLLDQMRQGDAVALARWYSLDCEARTAHVTKRDVRYVIARELGFKSWQSLKKQLNADDRP